MQIVKATSKDLPEILAIYERARQFMFESGNPHQWKNTHPRKDMLVEDIKIGQLYLLKDNDEILGVFAFIAGDDVTYQYIEGKWLSNLPYGVIHRIASSGKEKGILREAVKFAFTQVNSVRIDTHEDNKKMQYLLEKEGFTNCGTIYLQNGEARIAYQKDI